MVSAFVTWTAARRLTPELEVARQRNDAPTRFLDEEYHLDLLHRCLSDDDTIPIDVKVAGALILLYGVRIPRIHTLTTDRITTRSATPTSPTQPNAPHATPPCSPTTSRPVSGTTKAVSHPGPTTSTNGHQPRANLSPANPESHPSQVHDRVLIGSTGSQIGWQD
jgi:hypothetical protein